MLDSDWLIAVIFFLQIQALHCEFAIRLGKFFVSRLVFFANTPPKHDISV